MHDSQRERIAQLVAVWRCIVLQNACRDTRVKSTRCCVLTLKCDF